MTTYFSDKEKIITEYTPAYCSFLEAAYGEGMLSEGGEKAIQCLFDGVGLNGKTILDVGSGLGGMALYLASQYDCVITGIELNPAMVERANQSVPVALKKRVHFVSYEEEAIVLPFEHQQFDMVVSRGVFVQVKEKDVLFKEIARVIRKGGQFIIDDWLSKTDGIWDNRMETLKSLENLTLYAVSEAHYVRLLEQAGFAVDAMRNANPYYLQFNQEIMSKLSEADVKNQFIQQFGEAVHKLALECYQLIIDAIDDDVLLNRWMVATKVS